MANVISLDLLLAQDPEHYRRIPKKVLEKISSLSPEDWAIVLEQEQQAKKERRQMMLNILELAWEVEHKNQKLSFNQFCVILLTAAGLKDIVIAEILCKTLGNIRTTRCKAIAKLVKLQLSSQS